MKFLDKAKIYIKAGDGGNGSASFRREKYIEYGGPNGGDGSLVIGVCYATREEAEYLKVRERDALILARDVTYDMGGEPVWRGRQVINAERYQFKVLTNNMMQEGNF